MIVDTSAIVAIIVGEPEATAFAKAITSADRVGVSAASWIEATAALVRRYPAIRQTKLDELAKALAMRSVR